MRITPIYDFPRFDTGLFDGASFEMSGGDASLVVKVCQRDDIILGFRRVRWHEFTALYNCSPSQVEAYFRLVELSDSEAVARYVSADSAGKKAYKSLHHYRVFLDDHGCHELFAESAHGPERPHIAPNT